MVDPYDASDPDDVERAQHEAELREAQKQDFLLSAMRSEGGRLWFLGLLNDCGVFVKRFGVDRESDFYDGQRDIGIRVMRTLAMTHPQGLALILQEMNYG